MKAKSVLKILNITRPTLVKYHKTGLIKIDNVINRQYIYNDESVYSLLGLKKEKHNKINVIYTRTSNPPKKYLDEQTTRVLNFCTSNGITIEKEFSDIKSGMNFDRKGFNDLLMEVIKGKVDLLVIENKDRLVRFGFEMFETLCKFYGTRILVINDLTEKSYEQELTEDLISIIHYFSIKSYSNRRRLNKIKKELEGTVNDNN